MRRRKRRRKEEKEMVTSIVRRLRQKRTTSSPDAVEAVIVTTIIYIIVFVAVSILIKNYSIKWDAGQRIGIGIISGSSRNETKKTANIFCESTQQQQQQQQQQEQQSQWLEENFCIIDKTTTTSSSSPNLMLLLHRRLWKLLDRGIAPLINNTITEMKGWKTKLQDIIAKERRKTVRKIRAAAYKEKLLKTQRAKLNTSANHLKTISDLYLTSLMREQKLTDLCKRLTKLVPAKYDDKKCRKSEVVDKVEEEEKHLMNSKNN
mmetsp:Transcript_32272/g.54707  ORF Transcript_32272/g.54707 Transcript_32272/m.54707 type:complete len:262 (+) Transcript_32272:164-949(+)